jgi:hypothetical protein
MSVSDRALAARDSAEAVGRTSLWLAVTGLVLPILVAIVVSVVLTLANAYETYLRNGGAYYGLCVLLFVVLELAALVCGLVGWRSGSGKAGVILSGISLVLTVAAVVMAMGFWLVARDAPHAPGAHEHPAHEWEQERAQPAPEPGAAKAPDPAPPR